MIGRRQIPVAHQAWNRRWGAPYGTVWRHVLRRPRLRALAPRLVGPFGFQPDNAITRSFEYPWAFHAVPVRPGLRALEIGGSLAGLQFALAKSGVSVVNVDPGEKAVMGWPVNQDSIGRLNRAFGTDVELRNAFLEEAGLPAASFDLVYSISTIEHIPPDALPSLMAEVNRLLVPGGHFVLTVDLFLDLAPFSYETENIAGRNIDVKWLVDASGLELVQGDPAELYGYPEFDPKQVLGRLFSYQYGIFYPAVAQALVLRKPA